MVATFEDLYVSSLQGRPAAAAGAAEAAGI
jgi:hypothetical protein